VLAVEACGVCSSDLRAWSRPDAGRQPAIGLSGHEIGGRVLAVGTDAPVLVGERVCIDPVLASACGTCAACRHGRAWFCPDKRALATWGFAEAMVVPGRSVYRLPAALDATTATLVEPLACAVHALRSCATDPTGLHVAVVGAGVVGLLSVVAARALGAARVTAVARYEQQAAAATALGADEVLPADGGEIDALRSRRPEVVIEAVGGTANAFETAVEAVAPGGEVVIMGLYDRPQQLDAAAALLREKRILFSIAYGARDGSTDYAIAVDIAAGRSADLRRLVGDTRPLREIEAAFADAATTGTSQRIIVCPT
jgi:L-iditol 2-dehydrogenase